MRLETREVLKNVLTYEKSIYIPRQFRERAVYQFTQNERWLIYKYLRYLRFEEYYLCRGKVFRPLFYLYARRKNRLGNRIQIKIMPLYTGKGLNIHHENVIINGHIGEDCVFHGNNCIGNNIRTDNESEIVPRIQNRVEFGYGSTVIGDVFIADDVKIGAGAVVIRDILDKGTTAVGVPAHIVK